MNKKSLVPHFSKVVVSWLLKESRDFYIWEHNSTAVYISVRKWYLFPPSKNYIYPLLRHVYCGLFALILPCFAFILPFYFPFSLFLSPFFLFLSSFFFLFLLHFPSFPLPLFIFFPPNDIGWYFSPGGGYFTIYRPLQFYSLTHVHVLINIVHR